MGNKIKIKKGDMVYVIAGDDKGKTGKVLRVITEKNRAVVEGINMVKKHTKPNAKNTQGGIVDQEASINISNLQLTIEGKRVKVGRMVNETTKKIVRCNKKTKEEIK